MENPNTFKTAPEKEALTTKEMLSFLDNFKRDTSVIINHFDAQVNILCAVNIALLAISLTKIESGFHVLSFKILASFCLLSLFIGIYSVHPPKFMKKRKEDDIFYYRKILKSGVEGYSNILKDFFNSKEQILSEYTKYYTNIFKNYYLPKRKLFRISRALLFSGLILGFIFFII